MPKSKFVHFVYIPMSGVGLYGGYRGDDWYQARINIFKDYTLRSLKNQTEKNFTIWMSFRPQEEFNPLTAQLAEAIVDAGMSYVFTFNGLMYHDDKFGGLWRNKTSNMARILRGCYRHGTWRDLVPNIREIFNDKNSTLVERLGKDLPEVRQRFPEVDWVYFTRIDSDDMFHHETIGRIQAVPPEFKGAVRCDRGYIYNEDTGEMAEYHPKTNPPFHTIIFPAWYFFDAEMHVSYYHGFKSHEDIPDCFKTLRILQNAYCVLTHNPKNHISTTWNHPFRGALVGTEKLKSFI